MRTPSGTRERLKRVFTHSAVVGAVFGGLLTLVGTWGTPLVQSYVDRDRDKMAALQREKDDLQHERDNLENRKFDLEKSLKVQEQSYQDLVRQQSKTDIANANTLNEVRSMNASLKIALDQETQGKQEVIRARQEQATQIESLSTAVIETLNLLGRPDLASAEADYRYQQRVRQAQINKAQFHTGFDLFGNDTGVLGDMVKSAVDNAQDAAVGEDTARYAEQKISTLNARIDAASKRLLGVLSNIRVVQTTQNNIVTTGAIQNPRAQKKDIKPAPAGEKILFRPALKKAR